MSLTKRLRDRGFDRLPATPPPLPAPAKQVKTLAARLGDPGIYRIISETKPQPVTIPFGDWLPDLPPHANPGATVAKNVLPVERYYGPLAALEPASAALAAACLGATFARDTSGNYYNYAGDASALYEVRASGVTDKSKGGGYSTAAGESWRFALFKGTLIATNYSDPIQGVAVGSAGLFADHLTSTLTPKARDIAVIGQHIMLVNTNDATDGVVPYRRWWSAFGDSQDFDPDATTQSDYEDEPADGDAQRVIGGLEYGLVFHQTAVVRASLSGRSGGVFQFDKIDRKRGTSIPNSVIGHGRDVFFISDDGFMRTNGVQTYPIGVNQVDKTFARQFDVNDAASVSSAIDPLNKIVAWAIPSTSGVTKLFFYNWSDQRWSEAEVPLQVLVNTTSEGFTLEDLDAVALDSAADTTISVNEAGGQTVISVTSTSGFSVDDYVRITLNDATIHQSRIDAIGVGEITIEDALPSAADAGNRFVRTALDVLTPHPDSAQWKGGSPRFGAFDTANKLAYFDGANLAATLETGESEIFAGRYAKVTKVRPLIDGGTITAAVGSRDRLVDAPVFDPANAMDAIGEVGALNEGRYHRFRCKIAAGGEWSHAQGVQVTEAVPMGTGGFT